MLPLPRSLYADTARPAHPTPPLDGDRTASVAIVGGGQLACTPDHYPHIRAPGTDVMVCLGYNGRGVAMSSAMGPQLAGRMLGGSNDMPVTTIKEMPFHGLWRSGVAARVAYGRIGDMLGL